MSAPDREEICPDCQAGPDAKDARITWVMKDPATDEFYTVVTWHLDTCPTYTVEQIMMGEGVRRAKEKTAWAKEAFPAAYGRLLRAVTGVRIEESVQPFVAALVELVEAQGDDLSRYVPADRWVEILDQHFPPTGPVDPGEEPT